MAESRHWNWEHGGKSGGTYTPEYIAWANIKARCFNPNHEAYPRYGGVGITIHETWRDDFKKFLADVGPRPSEHHSIDRYPDGHGNYEPGNVRWATRKEQQNNLKTNVVIEINGQRIPAKEAAQRAGIPYRTLIYRLRHGWDLNRALSAPVNESRRSRIHRSSRNTKVSE